jgi:hypothetical protein
MAVTPDDTEVHDIAQACFAALRAMDTRCPTGLCDFVSSSPYAGKKRKSEPAITWGVTEALRKDWKVEQLEHRYPGSRKRCDRVIELPDESKFWLEIKLAWRTWFYDVVTYNQAFMYDGYFGGEHHSHSVAGDFQKLELIGSDHARYVGLLLVGFDGQNAKMADDMDALAKREKLAARKWSLISDSWVTRHSPECWHRCWFAWRNPPH